VSGELLPALLISTVTSGAAVTSASIEAGSVTSRASGTTRASVLGCGLRAVA
jgi:hypothetical protein